MSPRHRRPLAITLGSLVASGLLARCGHAQYLYSIRTDGILEWREHLGCLDGTFNWTPAQEPGSGWDGFKLVFSSGAGTLYAVQNDGTLLWYQHAGYHDGSNIWPSAKQVGTRWQSFKAVFPGADGVLYAIQNDGTLLWYRHLGWQDGSMSWAGPNVVGVGWQNFLSVFAGDGGAIYAIEPDGTLLWYRHLGAQNGAWSWTGPVTIGSSWQGFRQVFAGPNGVIYGLESGGALDWYRHLGYLDGTVSWSGPNVVGTGWDSFKSVFASTEPIEGYATPLSVAPGAQVEFHISSRCDYQVQVARYHRQADQNAPIAMTSATQLPAIVQGVPSQPWANDCGWSSPYQLQIPSGWTSGIYAAECTDVLGNTFRIAFVVRADSLARGHFAVLVNTNTWNAYNTWGGRSKYTGPPGQALTFARPNPSAAPIEPTGPTHLTRAELWALDWLASTGYRFDLYTDQDLDRGIPGMASYRGLIVQTHPEYWTSRMRDQLDAYLGGGGNLIYIAGNGLFEEVTYSLDQRTLYPFPGGQFPDRSYSYFRNLNPPRPDRSVVGVASCGDNWFTSAPLQVMDANHHLFAWTGVSNGDLIGASGLDGGASGWEMDTSIPGTAADGVIVSAYGSDDRGAPPGNLELLARGTNPGYGADMTYYRTAAGGFVFSAGSLSFVGSLVVDPILQTVVRNALREADEGTTDVHGSGENAGPAALGPIEPNPFSAGTTIRYRLPSAVRVRVSIYDVNGREVRILVDAVEPAGRHEVHWDGRARDGSRVPPGIYFSRLVQGEGGALMRRLALVR